MIKLISALKTYKSRRGDYRMVSFSNTTPVSTSMVWPVKELPNSDRLTDVIMEVVFAKEGRLGDHPYWKDEPIEFIDHYTQFYRELFGLEWLHEKEDRHNLVVNANCCLTLVQYNNGALHAYSRSTDMKNGYFSDRLLLNYLAEVINQKRPDCHVDRICWYLAVPHVYVEPGIARLK